MNVKKLLQYKFFPGGSINVQGEEQKKLDVLTNEILKRALYDTGKMGVLGRDKNNPKSRLASLIFFSATFGKITPVFCKCFEHSFILTYLCNYLEFPAIEFLTNLCEI